MDVPESWVIDKAQPSQKYIDNNPINIIQSTEGSVQIQFENPKIKYEPLIIRSNSSYYHISPIDYTVRSPSRASTSKTKKEFSDKKIEELRINSDNIVRGIKQIDPELTESEIDFV